jgi:hypothetical protein
VQSSRLHSPRPRVHRSVARVSVCLCGCQRVRACTCACGCVSARACRCSIEQMSWSTARSPTISSPVRLEPPPRVTLLVVRLVAHVVRHASRRAAGRPVTDDHSLAAAAAVSHAHFHSRFGAVARSQPPLPHLHRDWAHLATSAPGLGLQGLARSRPRRRTRPGRPVPGPRRRRGWGAGCRCCTTARAISIGSTGAAWADTRQSPQRA